MSVLNQFYIIENHNGDEQYTNNIAQYVEEYGERFRRVFGTNFNLRKYKEGESRWSRGNGSFYHVDLRCIKKEQKYSLAAKRFLWMATAERYERKADCLYIIRDGFGRIIHPDVIFRAYEQERGALKTPFNKTTYISAYGYVHTHGGARRDRGAKNGCYGRRRKTINCKRLITDYETSKLNIDDEPAIRKSKSFDDIQRHIEWWETPYRHVDRSWKTQTKAKKQWMKRK